jgi:hypothetical protein
VKGEGAGDGGFAGLPAAVEENLSLFTSEELPLPRVGGEAGVEDGGGVEGEREGLVGVMKRRGGRRVR